MQVSLPAAAGRQELAWRSDAGDPRVMRIDPSDTLAEVRFASAFRTTDSGTVRGVS